MSNLLCRMFTFSDTVHVRSATAIARLQNGSWEGRSSAKDALRVIMLTGKASGFPGVITSTTCAGS